MATAAPGLSGEVNERGLVLLEKAKKEDDGKRKVHRGRLIAK